MEVRVGTNLGSGCGLMSLQMMPKQPIKQEKSFFVWR